MDAVQGVDAAWAGCHVQAGQTAGEAEVAFRRHRERLFMMAADIAEIRVAPERVVQMHGAAAGQHEDMLHAMSGQGRGDVVGQTDHGGLHPEDLKMRAGENPGLPD